MNDATISELVEIFKELAETAGGYERTRVAPNCTVIDATPADLPADYIIIEDEEGYYIPAVKMAGLVYNDGDLVNVLYIKGTEPIAFQHGAGGSSGGFTLAISDEGVDQGDATTLDFVGAGVIAAVAGNIATITIAGGGGAWSFDHILTVSSTNAGASHTTIAAAITAASAGDAIWLDNETFTETLIINKAVTIFSGGGAVITSADAITIDCTAAGVVLRNLTIINTSVAGFPFIIDAMDTILDHCTLTSSYASCIGVYENAGSTFSVVRDCTINAGIGVITATGYIIIENGRITGATNDVTGPQLYLIDPILVNKTIVGGASGGYFDALGNHYICDTTGINSGIWLYDVSTGLKIKCATFAAALTAAATGDEIHIDPQTAITLNAVDINKEIAIIGKDAKTCTIQGTTNNSYVFLISANNVRIENLTITQTGAGGAGTNGWPVQITGNNCIIKDCNLSATGATAANYAVYHSAGNTTKSQLINCNISTSGATSNYGYVNGAAAAKMDIIGGSISGATVDIYSDQASIITLENPRLLGGIISITGSATLQGSALDDKGRDCGSIITNTSGGTVARGAIGYTDNTGSFKTTTTAQDIVLWHIATVGGANNSKIFAKNKGRATINYTGTAPNAGDYLVTSTTGGSAQQQTTMHPTIFAVCLTAGSGGTVDALLLTGSIPITTVSATRIYAVNSHSNSDFVATINGAPSATSVVYNAPSSGAADILVPASTPHLALLRLYNSTRGTYRLITAVNTGTSTITTVSSTDAWASGDTITFRDPTIADSNTARFGVLDLSQQTTVPVLARAVILTCQKADTNSVQFLVFHPVQAFSAIQQLAAVFNISTTAQNQAVRTVPLINQKFGWRTAAGAAGTASDTLLLAGYILASP